MQRGQFKVEKIGKVVRQSMEPQYNNQILKSLKSENTEHNQNLFQENCTQLAV